jgi:hypothetical protein
MSTRARKYNWANQMTAPMALVVWMNLQSSRLPAGPHRCPSVLIKMVVNWRESVGAV